MITRLYADNFRTLVNFELSLDAMNLLLGANGSGKSNVLETIRLIQEFVCAEKASTALFPTSSLCRWQTRRVQTFEVNLRHEDGTYSYKLMIEHETGGGRSRVKSEHLSYDNKVLYESQMGDAQLYHDDGVAGPKVLSDWNRSGVGYIQPRRDNTLLTGFKRHLKNVRVVQIHPENILPKSGRETAQPNGDMSNFVAWYRHLSQEKPTQVFELTQLLKNEVLDGFHSLLLKSVGEKSRALWAEFGIQDSNELPEKPMQYRFDELSDGQRSLVVLYTLSTCVLDEEGTLCLDHPESHLALPEIQPWLLRLTDSVEDGRCQAIIVTHHPEIINLLADHSGYWLERQSGGPTRVKKIGGQDSSGLPLSELIARGWLHG